MLVAAGLLTATFGLLPGHPGTPAAYAAAASPGVVLPSGRLVTPAGSSYDATRAATDRSFDLGDFPLGLALSPDGSMAVASLNGRGEGDPHGFNSFCEQDQSKAGVACPGVPSNLQVDPSVTAPDEGLDVIDTATGATTQATAVPIDKSPENNSKSCGKGENCFSEGVTFSVDGKHVYATGGGQDAIYDFAVSGKGLTLSHTVPVPSLSERVPAYPVLGSANGYPRGIAATPDGHYLVVADEFDSTVELFDVAGGKTPTLVAQGLVPGGIPGAVPLAYLYGVAVSPDSSTAYVTAQGTGIVYAINIAAFSLSGIVTNTVTGPLTANQASLSQLPALLPAVAVPFTLVGLDHPTGVAVSPDGSSLLVSGTNSDNVAFVPLVGGAIPVAAVPTVVPVSVTPRAGVLGSMPTGVAWSHDGRTAYVALAGDDADAVIDTATHTVSGYVPTGWYPTAVGTTAAGDLWTVSAKGLGSRYVPGVGGYVPGKKGLPVGQSLPSSDYYDAENMPGTLTKVTAPTGAKLAAYSTVAADDVLHAGGLDQRPAVSPIPIAVGGTSPITHVVYIVRENRTFDQVFGDLALTRADVDADPFDQVLAAATPNAHAVSSQFAIADHFFSDGEASVQGHWWTSSAAVDDYVEKSWRQYYSPRGRPGDSAIVPITSTPGCSIFQDVQAYATTHPAFTYRNYGELVGLIEPSTSVSKPQANLCQGAGPIGPASLSVADPNYPTQASLTPDDRTRAAEFLKDSGLNADGTDAGNGNSLRNFNYLILSEDHTSGLAGTQTPRSQVAQNDAALGEMISALSKSKYWSSTAVFAVEDDSQDGVDHVDGHRNVLLVASPWTKHVSADQCVPGYIGHAHYDQAGVLRTIELILGLNPLSTYDQGASPLYDLFQSKDQPSQLTADDLKPFTVAPAPSFIDETVASLPKTAQNQALIAYSKTLDLSKVDVAEPGVESVLWQSVRNDPVPTSLAERVGPQGHEATGDGGITLPGQGETSSARLDTSYAPDTALAEARPGTPPALSTVTGQPYVGTAPTCAKPVKLTTPVKPGQTKGGRKPVKAPSTGSLAATGVRSTVALLGLALVLAGLLAGRQSRRKQPSSW